MTNLAVLRTGYLAAPEGGGDLCEQHFCVIISRLSLGFSLTGLSRKELCEGKHDAGVRKGVSNLYV